MPIAARQRDALEQQPRDIFNFLLLAWNEGQSLGERYPALGAPPLSGPLSNFRVTPYGGMPVSEGVRGFDELPRDRYRQVFDAVFVQRTRSMLETRRLSRALDFPQRLVHAHNTPPSETRMTECLPRWPTNYQAVHPIPRALSRILARAHHADQRRRR